MYADSTLTFTARLGITQPGSAATTAILTCGAQSTTKQFFVESTAQQVTIDTPAAQINSECRLFVRGTSEGLSYVAPTVAHLLVVPETLIVQVPVTTVEAGELLAFSVIVPEDPAIAFPVSMKLYCNDALVGSQSTTTSASTQYFPVSNAAIGVCQFNTTNSNTVDVTVQQQLSIASSLNGWTSGSTVIVNITSPNLEAEQITLSTSCSIGSFSQQITTSSNANYFIADGTNGVQCLLSTLNLPQYYLPIPPTFVNIGLDPQQQQSIIQSLQLPLFIDNLVRDRELQDLQKSAKIKSIRRFLKKPKKYLKPIWQK